MTVRTVLRALVACIVAAIAVGGVQGCGGSDEGRTTFRYVSATPKGEVIPIAERQLAGQISADVLDGGTFSLSAHQGEVVFINFWGAWCGPCAAEAPILDSIYEQFKDEGVLVVGIAVRDVEDLTRAFIKNNDISYPNIFDFNARSAVELGHIPVRGLPQSVAVDRHGRIAGVYAGAVTAGDVEPVLEQLLNETG